MERKLSGSSEPEDNSASDSITSTIVLASFLRQKRSKRSNGKRKREKTESEVEEEEINDRTAKKMKGGEEQCELSSIAHKQQRCTLVSFFNLVDEHKKSIPEEAWELINKTCFGEMIQAFRSGKIDGEQVKREESDIEILLHHYNREKKNFTFGERVLEITEDDVHQLFAITKEGEDVDISIDRKYSKGNKNSQDSAIFGKEKGPITTKIIREKLEEELNKIKKRKEEPRKIASLVIMYLMSVFFFSRTGRQLEWKLVLACEDLEGINKYNWSSKVLEALHDGIKKHVKAQPKALNGCLVLVLYWFLEKTQIKSRIWKKKTETPRFIRWSTLWIINKKDYLNRPKMLEELVANGPWLDEEEISSSSPSFQEWVPQFNQNEAKENQRLCGNIRTLIHELEGELPEEKNQKLKQLAKASEELFHKLKIADEKIREMELQKRQQDKRKRKRREDEKRNENLSDKKGDEGQLEEENMGEYDCREDEQRNENVSDMTGDEKDRVESPIQEDLSTIKHVECANNTWNNLDDNVKKHYKNWLELHPDKGKDEQYWQSTEGLHGLSKDDLKRIIEGKYTTSSSLTVYIEEHLKKQANAFFISAGFIDMEVTRSVIEYEQKRQNQVNFESGREKEMEDILYQALMPVFCKSLVFIPLHHGDSSHYTLLLIDTINSCFYHMNSMRPGETISESHNFHFENAKFVVKYINAIMERVLEREVEMTDTVKETRRWILDKKINRYELIDSVSCPQQDKTSTDCGPFMLYFIEEVMSSTELSKLTKEGGEDMRRKMLHVFAHLNDVI